MKQLTTRGSLLTLAVGTLMGIVFSAGFFAGGISDIFAERPVEPAPGKLTPEMVLRADGAAGGEKISLATGLVAEGNEGLFALDHTTGDLYCWVLNPRQVAPNQYRFHAEYTTNVHDELDLNKGEKADLVMTIGNINTTGMPNVGNARPATCACYVADGNTGRVGGFCFYFNRNALNQKQLQKGSLVKVAEAITRGNIERD